MEHEIAPPGKFLPAEANLREPGLVRSFILKYDRADIKALAWIIKERHYYCDPCGHNAPAFTMIGKCYTGVNSVSVLDLGSGMNATDDLVTPFPLGSRQLPARTSSCVGEDGGKVAGFYFNTAGTPSGVGPLRAGDVFEVEIDGIGILRNPVTEA